MRPLLLNPPFADPTQPYLSLPTLKGALRRRGLDVEVCDLNLEGVHWLFSAEGLEALTRRMRSTSKANQAEHWPTVVELLKAEPAPLEVFQRADLFFDRAAYARAVKQVEGLLAAISAACAPYRFGFNEARHRERPWSLALLEEYADGDDSPVSGYYDEFLDARNGFDDLPFAGISVAFPSQLAEAFHLARRLRERAPDAFIALGGPCAHQVLVHMPAAQRARVLATFDGVGLFEGEALLAELLPRLDAWRAERDPARRFELLRDVPHLLQADPTGGDPREGPRHTLDLTEAEPPDYSDLDLDRYLAPERTLLYAPTRGCYWAKCSFCYYGLAETGTARYREIPPERAATQLARLARRHGVRNVYLSCDVLSPSYAVRLSEALIAQRAPVRWHSDLKIERYFTPERCELLHRGGLRAAAFGIESGSDRILEQMRKGSDRATMTEVNRAFQNAGIATQWMAFTDHPGETGAEALETVEWIEAEADAISLFHVGRFGLEPGSHVAQEPGRYGIRDVRRAEGDDLGLELEYREPGAHRRGGDEARVERALSEVAERFALRSYPWAGSISTHHTFLHLVANGPSAFHARGARRPRSPVKA